MFLRLTYLEALCFFLAVVFVSCWFIIILFHMAAIYYARFRLYKSHPPLSSDVEAGLPGVSILKPIKGREANILSNLRTFFLLDYPRFELLFCLESKDDPIYNDLLALKNEFPHVDSKILFHSQRVGVNPKVNNLFQGYQVARYELLLISDSGIRTKEDTLKEMVGVMTGSDRVGLVHQVPFVFPREGFGNMFHVVYFGTWHAKMYLGSAFLGINCTTGMSCLVRKEVVDRAPNGLAHFGRYLAEDYFLSQHVYNEGYKVLISSQLAWQNGATDSVVNLCDRIIRWYKLRTAFLPHTIFLEPLTECLPTGILTAWSLNILFGDLINSWVFFLCHCLLWFLLDYVLLRNMLPTQEVPCSKFDLLCVWLFRELVSIPNQFRGNFFKREVRWRDKRYRVRWGGGTEEIYRKCSNVHKLVDTASSTATAVTNVVAVEKKVDADSSNCSSSPSKCDGGGDATSSIGDNVTAALLLASSDKTTAAEQTIQKSAATSMVAKHHRCISYQQYNKLSMYPRSVTDVVGQGL